MVVEVPVVGGRGPGCRGDSVEGVGSGDRVGPKNLTDRSSRSGRKTGGDRYVINHESLAHFADPGEVIDHLVDCLAQLGWDRRRLCRGCETWQTKDGLENFPRRPGAAAPTESCNGCWYSYLDSKADLEREARRAARAARGAKKAKRRKKSG